MCTQGRPCLLAGFLPWGEKLFSDRKEVASSQAPTRDCAGTHSGAKNHLSGTRRRHSSLPVGRWPCRGRRRAVHSGTGASGSHRGRRCSGEGWRGSSHPGGCDSWSGQNPSGRKVPPGWDTRPRHTSAPLEDRHGHGSRLRSGRQYEKGTTSPHCESAASWSII